MVPSFSVPIGENYVKNKEPYIFSHFQRIPSKLGTAMISDLV